MIDALASGVHAVFVFAIPVVLVAFALAWLLKELPLRTAGSAATKDLAAEPASVLTAP